MNTHQPRHRRASKADVVARAVVVVGLAASIGLLMGGAGPAVEYVVSSASCPAAASAPFAAL